MNVMKTNLFRIVETLKALKVKRAHIVCFKSSAIIFTKSLDIHTQQYIKSKMFGAYHIEFEKIAWYRNFFGGITWRVI